MEQNAANPNTIIYAFLFILSLLTVCLVFLSVIMVWAALKKFDAMPDLPRIFDPGPDNKQNAKVNNLNAKITVIETADPAMAHKPKEKEKDNPIR